MNNFENQGLLIGNVVKVKKVKNGTVLAVDTDERSDHQSFNFVWFKLDNAIHIQQVQPKQKVMISAHLEARPSADQSASRIVTVGEQLRVLS